MEETSILFGAGSRLRYPVEVTAKAIMLYDRLAKEDEEDIVKSATCLFLAGKAHEEARRVRDVLNAVYHAKEGTKASIAPLDEIYFRRKERVVDLEQRLLRELGFNVSIDTSHRLVCNLGHAIGLPDDQVQEALAFANDALWSRACRALEPDIIACAALALASGAQPTQLAPAMLGVSLSDRDAACEYILDVVECLSVPRAIRNDIDAQRM